MSRPPFDPFDDLTVESDQPRALEWLDPDALPAYAEDAHGRVLFDHRLRTPLSRSVAAALGCVAGMLLITVAAVVIEVTR